MKLAACKRLRLQTINAKWFRAIPSKHWKSPLGTAHTSQVSTRFNPGPAAEIPFEILYLAENQVVALYEVSAIFGPPGRPTANPHNSEVSIIDVSVRLQSIADLTDASQQKLLGISAQELTGNWDAFPAGEVTTQRLGAALFATPDIEGFLAISAKQPLCKTLIVFPQKLREGSELSYKDPRSRKIHRIPIPGR